MTAPLLRLAGATAGYGEIEILHDLTIEVQPGSITALLGSNGAGKTTTMRCICGLLPLARGSLEFSGAGIAALPACRRVELGISLVPEGRMVFPDFSVEENLQIGAFIPRVRAQRARLYETMYGLFPVLKERRRQAAGTLSGGEQQMLALARSLMSEPRLILLDEPSLGLAPRVVSQLFKTVQAIRDSGVTVLIVEQNMHRTLEIADYAFVLENGRLAMQGGAGDVKSDPHVRQAYLGL
jgi:branched-chain amino acid transport system ATP-binding protein